MLKTNRRAANKGGPSKQVTVTIAKRSGGSCAGVKYPCTYSCKKCFYDIVYH